MTTEITAGTDALIIALRAIGVGPGDEVVIPANSFAATENAVLACGAIPVLADVTLPDGNLDPSSVEAVTTARAKAIMPVHLYGKFADMAGLRSVADRHGLAVVEDACQAIGVTGVGQWSDAAALSFNPYKNFGLCGKAGAIVARSGALADRCHALSYHGFEPGRKNVKTEPFGLNSRMDNTMAHIALALLPWLSLRALRRTYLTNRYIELLDPLVERFSLSIPVLTHDNSWHLFPVVFTQPRTRDDVRARMREDGVETDLYYPVLTHQHNTSLRAELFEAICLPATEWLHARILHLPLHSAMTPAQQDIVVSSLTHALEYQPLS